MDFISACIYGIIQGLTEFLPVSSSGHLALLPSVLAIKDPGVTFDLAMHVGTAFSIFIYFRQSIALYMADLLRCLKNKKVDSQGQLAVNMVMATLMTFVFALLFKPLAEEYGRNVTFIAINLAVFGVVMWGADYFAKDQEDVPKKMTMGQLIGYGLFQALAIFPGVSRSGITLTYSRFIGMKREDATTFSFLLALPLIVAGFILKLPTLADPQSNFDLLSFSLGILVSFTVGLVTIHYFLKVIKKMGLGFFALYRLALSLLITMFLL